MHEADTKSKRLGEALEVSQHDAWSVWRSQHTKHLTSELAWATEVKRIETAVHTLHEGRLRITVKVAATKPHRTDQYFYQWESAGHGLYTLEAYQ